MASISTTHSGRASAGTTSGDSQECEALRRVSSAVPATDSTPAPAAEDQPTPNRVPDEVRQEFHETARRIEAASSIVKNFGVATECGFGRRDLETIPELMDQHAEVADEI